MKQNNEWRRWEAKEHSVCPLDDLDTPVEVKLRYGRILDGICGRFIWSTDSSMGNMIVAWRYLRFPVTPVPATDDMKHPLINENSRHHQMPDGSDSIEQMELLFTREQLMSWALITSYKYRFRIGKKDDAAKEVEKINIYEKYYRYLERLPKEKVASNFRRNFKGRK